MNGFDGFVAGVVGLSMLLGFWRGLVSEAIALAAWLVGILAAKQFGPQMVPLVSQFVSQPALQLALAYAAVFVAVLMLVALVRWLVRELVRAAGLGLADRMLGAVFGMLRGGAIVYAVALIAGLGGFGEEDWWREAKTSAPLEKAVTATREWLPEPLTKRLRYR